MLLFLIGIDLPTVIVLLFLLALFGLLAFYVSRIVFRKVLKDAADERIDKLSRTSAYVLSPLLLIGFFALLIYAVTLTYPVLSPEEEAEYYYGTLDENLQNDLKVGMSKKDVLEIFGESDTTQSVMVYDMSLDQKKGEYVVEITFENDSLVSFQRKQ